MEGISPVAMRLPGYSRRADKRSAIRQLSRDDIQGHIDVAAGRV